MNGSLRRRPSIGEAIYHEPVNLDRATLPVQTRARRCLREVPLPELVLTCPGTGKQRWAPSRSEPLSPSRYRIEFTASAEFHRKLQQARELLSHVLPSGD